MAHNCARCIGAELYFLPVKTRIPLKFGHETLTSVTCARVRLVIEDEAGNKAEGWGETPLSVQWAWPSQASYEERHALMKEFCKRLAARWAEFDHSGHPIEVGHEFMRSALFALLDQFNAQSAGPPMPWLAALICCSAFDIAFHDAYGHLHGRPIYELYSAPYMAHDLSRYLTPASSDVSFAGRYPSDYFVQAPDRLLAWHLVGGNDFLRPEDGAAPVDDGYPVVLDDWITADQLACLKIKLRGNDEKWDYKRIVEVGRIALERGVTWLTCDFNCTVLEVGYVVDMLDRLLYEHPKIYAMILYVEQPFPYDLDQYSIDVHAVSARKPLFMDESAHDWQHVARGRELGWTGVALKTCKTQTGALLSLCWAKAHGMTLMVQDLTNPMLAQIPHVLLAAHAGTIAGVETNAMQFYPEASALEQEVHPGLYRRRHGSVDLSTIKGPGFGYRLPEINRPLPPAEATFFAKQ